LSGGQGDSDGPDHAAPADRPKAAEDPEQARQRAVDLLEANHTFPCEFSLSVIARNEAPVRDAILAAAAAVHGSPLPESAYSEKPSAQGKYLSHRLLVGCATADDVLRLYARLRAIDGVITVL
jgi:putative lipoic acid-binding regulatory protein